ncbi:hypothetical protein HY256_08800 [Candidatus Sumerlaeota bacterium]|nr:hypothetical protein [Candidatus Sumerlaeota bacterium]
MTRIEKIEAEIQTFSSDEFDAFREWFDAYAANEWDRQIERDAKAGKLDRMAERAIAEHRAGRSTEL